MHCFALFILGSEDRGQLLEQRRQDSALVLPEDQLTAQYETTHWPAEVANGHRAELADVKERWKMPYDMK